MIILDTHVWIWWALGLPNLRDAQRRAIADHETDQIGICTFSCWEVAKLVLDGRLQLPVEIAEWFNTSVEYPGIVLLDMTPEIAIESNRLPGDFHRDPADQIPDHCSYCPNIPMSPGNFRPKNTPVSSM